MAESPLDRLKRLAAEKKQAAQPVLDKQELVELVTPNTEANLEARFKLAAEAVSNGNDTRTVEEGTELQPVSGSGDRKDSQSSVSVETQQPDTSVSTNSNIGTSDHPLAMQFAELEQALLAQQPEFKTILRQIHRHLGKEPELVTQMTEQEIQMIVSGLVIFANAEIVAPAIVKTAKAAIKAAKAKPISADDL